MIAFILVWGIAASQHVEPVRYATWDACAAAGTELHRLARAAGHGVLWWECHSAPQLVDDKSEKGR